MINFMETASQSARALAQNSTLTQRNATLAQRNAALCLDRMVAALHDAPDAQRASRAEASFPGFSAALRQSMNAQIALAACTDFSRSLQGERTRSKPRTLPERVAETEPRQNAASCPPEAALLLPYAVHWDSWKGTRKERSMCMGILKIDEDECIGCQSCVELCPEVFQMAGDHAIVLQPDSTLPGVDQAIEVCPVNCISKE